MAEITATMVNELRKRTSAGIMECKKALVEAQGDLEKAEDIIAKSGSRKAEKTASRTAAEGRIVVAQQSQGAVVLEINCETDFVGRSDGFIEFAQKVAQIALDKKVQTPEDLLAASYDGQESIEQARQGLIGKIGENIQIRRLEFFECSANQNIGSYIHHGRIGGLVLLEGGSPELAKDMAMQLVAMKAPYISSEDVPEPVVAKEKDILMERSKLSGKPENMLEKIVAGQLKKFFDEICIVGQAFFKDPDQTVGALLKANNAKIIKMVRLELGEGIEVIKKSFEEEVAQARGK